MVNTIKNGIDIYVGILEIIGKIVVMGGKLKRSQFLYLHCKKPCLVHAEIFLIDFLK